VGNASFQCYKAAVLGAALKESSCVMSLSAGTIEVTGR